MQISVDSITMRCPDNFHAHLREGPMLPWMVHQLLYSGWCGRVLAMPNLANPILTGEQAVGYRRQILEAANGPLWSKHFDPIVTIQITESTTPDVVFDAKKLGIRAAKVYPRNVTTNSEHGVVDYRKIYPALQATEQCGMVVCFHSESPDPVIEGKDKEADFLRNILNPIRYQFPKLRIVVEHITTAMAVKWIEQHDNVGATITIHHLLFTLDDLLGYTEDSHYKGNFHLLCKPMLKWDPDRSALQYAAMSGNPKFFYGGDDAPHYKHNKECAHCACGVFNTTVALPLLIKLFQPHSLNQLEDFLSRFGVELYGLPLNNHSITLVRQKWTVPAEYQVFDTEGESTSNVVGSVVPLCARQELDWQIAS